MLSAEKGIITNVLVLPGTETKGGSALMHLYMLPIDLSVVGTVHSHPTNNLTPSGADLRLFRARGTHHIITCHPYEKDDWACYDAGGGLKHLEVLDVKIDDGFELWGDVE